MINIITEFVCADEVVTKTTHTYVCACGCNNQTNRRIQWMCVQGVKQTKTDRGAQEWVTNKHKGWVFRTNTAVECKKKHNGWAC